MLRIRKVKPTFHQILVTKDVYGYDVKNEAGIVVAVKGDIKDYQTVVAVADGVESVKPGDVVVVNYYRYAKFKEDPNSVKALNRENPVVELHLDEVDIDDKDGFPKTCFFIDERDVKYILEDFDEVVYDNEDNLIEVPTKKLILPKEKKFRM